MVCFLYLKGKEYGQNADQCPKDFCLSAALRWWGVNCAWGPYSIAR